MVYKAVAGNTPVFSNNDGKSSTSRPFVGVGIFDSPEAQTYTLLLKIEKNIDDPMEEADRIAGLLNSNRTFFTRKEVEERGEAEFIVSQ